MGLRIVVDYELCESNGLCMQSAPEVFDLRDDDVLVVLQDRPDEELSEKVYAAADRCPKRAISVEDW